MSIDWPTAAPRATASAKFDLGRDEANAGFGVGQGVDQDVQAPVVGSALVKEGGGSSSSLDRFLELMAADDTKKVMLSAFLYQTNFDMVTEECWC